MLGGGSSLYGAWNIGASAEKAPINRAHVIRIARTFRPHTRWALGSLTVIATSASLGLVPPLLLRALLDHALPEKNLGLLGWLCAGMVVVPVVVGLLGVLETYLDERISQAIMLDLRLDLFRHLQGQTLGYFTGARPGELTSRLHNDVNELQDVFSDTVLAIASNILTILTTLLVLIPLSWPLAVFALAILPLFVLPARHVGRKRQEIVSRSQERKGELTAYLQDAMSIPGFLMRRLFGQSERESRRYEQICRELSALQIRRSLLWRWLVVALTLFSSLGPALVYGAGGWLAIREGLSVGTLVAFVAYLGRLYGPVSALANVHVNVMGALAVFDRLFQLLDQKPEIVDAVHARDLDSPEGHIHFENVTFRYRPDKPLLEDVSFEARPGEFVAIVGPSGAGKSTLAYLLARFFDPASGSVRIDGHDLRELTQASLHGAIGYVTQDPFLFHTTIRENLRYARPEATDEELVEACRKAALHEAIVALPEGYDTVVGERGYRMSGGEKQRLALARVILKAPRILVLDEATSSLDSRSEAIVQEALAGVMAGRTTLAIAHRLSTIVEADRILVIEQGRLVEQGTHAELMIGQGIYSRLFAQQLRDGAAAV
jgi:ATP-binding cassette subfamily B protein